ncbi:hypothetical protein [Sphingomonas paucimobilis]|uniref:hypothetical protein n=1 Tax=Sphingomonas paucimobilis TaxID=13689 RepID=UPI0028D5195A|nr:hypothetical protein [Sphingomonas paucimobilis]
MIVLSLPMSSDASLASPSATEDFSATLLLAAFALAIGASNSAQAGCAMIKEVQRATTQLMIPPRTEFPISIATLTLPPATTFLCSTHFIIIGEDTLFSPAEKSAHYSD